MGYIFFMRTYWFMSPVRIIWFPYFFHLLIFRWGCLGRLFFGMYSCLFGRNRSGVGCILRLFLHCKVAAPGGSKFQYEVWRSPGPVILYISNVQSLPGFYCSVFCCQLGSLYTRRILPPGDKILIFYHVGWTLPGFPCVGSWIVLWSNCKLCPRCLLLTSISMFISGLYDKILSQ